MSEIDYANVKADELEMAREPRQAKVTVKHKPTGQVAQDPVVPGTLAPARFRRPTTLPKENRVKGMEGYIEGADKSGMFVIVTEGDSPRNEYLEALAGDAAALKASFEGVHKPEKEAKTDAKSDGAAPAQAAPKESAAQAQQKSLEETPTESAAQEPPVEEAPAAEPTEEPAPAELEKLDDLLANLEA